MSEIKSNGVPTRKTKGALGDIYIDGATGIKYKCTGSYIQNGQSEYEWKKVLDITKRPGVQQTKEVKPHDSSLSKPAKVKKTAKKAEEKVEEKVEEAPVEEVKETKEAKAEPAAEKKPAKNNKSNKQHDYGQHFNGNK